MRGTVRYRGKEQKVYTLLSRGYIPFKWKLYYFVPMLYYFQANVILLSSESYITFLRSLLEPLTKAL